MSSPLYPITAAWYDALPPQKLRAFPGCEAHTRLPREIERSHPTLASLPQLPPAWRRALQEGFTTEWVPEARLVLQYLLLRDACFADDASFLQAAKGRIKASFMSPLIRPMMAVVSPHLLILGAGTRWRQYHRGTQLEVKSQSMHSMAGTLHFPPGLYPDLMVADTRVAVQASLEMTGKEAEVVAKVVGPGVCALTGRWS